MSARSVLLLDQAFRRVRKADVNAHPVNQPQLPEVVERLSDVYYHRGSPYSGEGKDTTDRTHGDLHQVCALEQGPTGLHQTDPLPPPFAQWNVWHGEQKPWTEWGNLSGRFGTSASRQ